MFELDENVQHAFITSSDKSYLWFLSRSKEIDDTLKQSFIDKVTELGFDVDSIIFVNQQATNDASD